MKEKHVKIEVAQDRGPWRIKTAPTRNTEKAEEKEHNPNKSLPHQRLIYRELSAWLYDRWFSLTTGVFLCRRTLKGAGQAHFQSFAFGFYASDAMDFYSFIQWHHSFMQESMANL